MALVLRDRVKETTSTAGTGTYALAGAADGFETFASVGDGNTTYYGCSDGSDFEVGIGTYTASGTTLARTTILQSSNGDNAVNWGTGTRTIFCTLPAEKMSFLDASGNLIAANGSALTNLNGSNISSGTVPVARIETGTTAGKIIVLDGSARLPAVDGSQLTNLNAGAASITADSFTGDNSTTAFTVTTAPSDADDLLVTINGLIQRPTTDYTVSGTTLTFTSVPFTGANIFARLIGGSNGSADLSSVDQNIVPDTDVAYDIGTSSKRFRDIYLSGSTIDLGGATFSVDATSGAVAVVPKSTTGTPNPLGVVFTSGGEMKTVTSTGGVVTDSEIATAAASDDVSPSVAVVTNTGDLPSTTTAGTMGFVTSDNKLHVYNGSAYAVAAGYSNSDVDTHLNTSTATSGEVLSWTGSDYDWIAAGGGGGGLGNYGVVNSDGTAASALGIDAIAIGEDAHAYQTRSISIGNNAGRANVGSFYGVNIGYYAGKQMTGNYGICIGNLAGGSTTNYGPKTGINNIAIGHKAMTGFNTGTGYGNIAIGSDSTNGALYKLTSGYNNIVLGGASGYNITTGNRNVVIGAEAGTSITTGFINTIVGRGSGANVTTGFNNIMVGTSNSASASGVSRNIIIGNSLTGKGADTAFIGGTSGAYNGANSSSWSTTSDERIKTNITDYTSGLTILNQVNVKTYNYLSDEAIAEAHPELADDDGLVHEGLDTEKTIVGIVAQELETVLPDSVTTRDNGIKVVNNDELFWVMLNSIKELKTANDLLAARVEALENV